MDKAPSLNIPGVATNKSSSYQFLTNIRQPAIFVYGKTGTGLSLLADILVDHPTFERHPNLDFNTKTQTATFATSPEGVCIYDLPGYNRVTKSEFGPEQIILQQIEDIDPIPGDVFVLINSYTEFLFKTLSKRLANTGASIFIVAFLPREDEVEADEILSKLQKFVKPILRPSKLKYGLAATITYNSNSLYGISHQDACKLRCDIYQFYDAVQPK